MACIPVDFVEKIAKQWEELMQKGKPVTFKEVSKGIPKAMQDFWQRMASYSCK